MKSGAVAPKLLCVLWIVLPHVFKERGDVINIVNKLNDEYVYNIDKHVTWYNTGRTCRPTVHTIKYTH